MVASPLLPSMPVTPTLPPSGVSALPTMPGTPSGVQPEPNSLDDILNEIDASTKMPLPGQTTPNTPQPNNPFPFPPTNQNSPFSAGPNPYSNYWNQINNPIIDLPSMNFPPMGQLGSNPILSSMMNSQNNMIPGMGPNPNSNLPIIKQEPGLFNQNASLQTSLSPSAAPSSPMVSPVPPRTAPVAPSQQLRPETSSLIAETVKKADKKRRKSSSSQKLPTASSSLTPPTSEPGIQGHLQRPRMSSLTQNSSLAALLKSSTPPTLPSSTVTPPKPTSTTSGRDHVNSLFNPTSSSPTLQTSTMFQDLIKKILKQQQQKPSTPKEIQEQAQLILQNANFNRNQLSEIASLGNLTKPTPTPPPPTAAATPTGSTATSSLSSLLQSSNSNLDKHRQLFGGLELLFQNQSPDTAAVAKAAAAAAAATKTQKQNQTKEENQTTAPQGLDAARDLLRKIKSIRETSSLIDAPAPSISLSGSTATSSGGVTVKRERKASVTKAEPKVTKKLKIDTSAPPREPETKIVHSPNVKEVTTLETPSGTLILTPTKASAKAVAKKRKLPTGEPSRGLKSPKRVRNSSRSPVRAQQSSGSYQRPSRRSLPPAAYRGKLPQIKLTRKNGQKWTISDYIFPTTVPDSELDCTKIIEKAVQRRQRRKSGKRAPSAQKTPPPLQRAPQEGPTPSGSAVKQLPILSPAPATSPASCTVAVISPPPLTPSTPGAPTQSVTTTPQSVESNNPPVSDTVMPSLKIKIKLSKNNNPPPTTTSSGGGTNVRSTPRKAKREVKYTVDQWWDEDTL